MDIIQLGAQLLSEHLGLDVDSATLQSALSGLLGDGQGGVDFGALAARMGQSGGLEAVLGSWLGDGANAPISAESVLGLLGEGNVAEFAGKIGTDTGTAASGLSDILPQMMDRASSGGSLLASAGGLGGLMSAANNFLK